MGRRLRRPREPAIGECCGSGCTRCVYDIYYDALQDYETQLHVNESIVEGDSSEKSLTTDKETEPSDTSEQTAPVDYLGAVVVEFLSASLGQEEGAGGVERALALAGYLPLSGVHVVQTVQEEILPHLLDHGAACVQSGMAELEKDVGGIYRLALTSASLISAPAPGDVVELLVSNDHPALQTVVGRVCGLLRLSPRQLCRLNRSPFVPEGHFPPWLPEGQVLTVGQLLSNFVDLTGPDGLRRPRFWQHLWQLQRTTRGQPQQKVKSTSRPTATAVDFNNIQNLNEVDVMMLLEACVMGDEPTALVRALRAAEAEAPAYPTVLDVLQLLPKLELSLERFLELTGPLPTRRFSIAGYTANTAQIGERATTELELCVRHVVRPRAAQHQQTSKETGEQVLSSNTTPLLRQNVSSCAAAQVLVGKLQAQAATRGSLFFGHTTHSMVWTALRQRTPSAEAINQITASTTTKVAPASVSSLCMFLRPTPFASSCFARGLTTALHSLVAGSMAPVLLFGAGTGIAPIRAAVQFLLCRAPNLSSPLKRHTPFPCWVFYAARTRSEMVYHVEFQAARSAGLLAGYDPALSRGELMKVLASRQEVLRTGLLEQEGHFFGCGPTPAMAAVRNGLQNRFLSDDDDDESMREQRMELLVAKERIMFDLWTSGDQTV